MQHVGIHYIWDVSNIPFDQLAVVADVQKVMSALHSETDLTILAEKYNQFEPHGVTGFLLLSESHFSIHTWPEHGFACLDLFSCKPIDYKRLEDRLSDFWPDCVISFNKINRGQL